MSDAPQTEKPLLLKDGRTSTLDPRLDRIVQFDEASRDFPVRQLLRGAAEPVTRMWTVPGDVCLDQGREGACGGFGVTHELLCHPEPIPGLDAQFAREQIYWNAQRADAWDGGAYPGASPFYEGTSVLAVIKQGVALGYYGEYRWAFGEADLALSIANIGPAVLGVTWHRGMYTPNTRGYLRPTGGVIGGHCLLCVGIDVTGSFYTVLNSWGPRWGNKGTAKISRADMARLLADKGEACVITQRMNPTAGTEAA